MDEKRTAVEKTEQGIVWTDAEGKRHEFVSTAKTMYIEAVELQARYSVKRHEDNERLFDVPFEESISAVGELVDDNIEEIGLPESRSRTVKVLFYLLTEELAAKLPRSSPDYKLWTVSLFFLAADREVAQEAAWCVDCPLSPAQFNKLSQALGSRQITKLALGLNLNNAYVDFEPPLPIGGRNWFVLPTDWLRTPQSKYNGFIRWFNLETPPLDLRPPKSPQEREP